MAFLPFTTLVAALGCGLMAGLFFAFSTAVMPGFARLPPSEAAAAMKAINRAILNPLFLSTFFVTAAACLVVAIAAVIGRSGQGGPLLVAAGVLYLAGGFGVTVLCNVPRNEGLDRWVPGDAEAGDPWRRYLREWTFWNHVRTVASLAAAALLSMALAG